MTRLIMIPVISAFIGYLTNVVAIKMLFYPREAVSVLGMEFQGLIPRRQDEIATKVGEIVERELISVNDMVELVSSPEMQEKMLSLISERARSRIEEAIPRIIPPNLSRSLADALYGMLMKEARTMTGQVVRSAGEHLTSEIKVQEIVRDRLLAFEVAELEKLVKEVAARELKGIELMGGVLGFLIGLVQVGWLILIP